MGIEADIDKLMKTTSEYQEQFREKTAYKTEYEKESEGLEKLAGRLKKYRDLTEKIDNIEAQCGCGCLPIPLKKRLKILKRTEKLRRRLDKEYTDVIQSLL